MRRPPTGLPPVPIPVGFPQRTRTRMQQKETKRTKAAALFPPFPSVKRQANFLSNAALAVLAFFLVLPTNAFSKAARLAIIVEDSRLATEADLLTAELSKRSDLELLEREQVLKMSGPLLEPASRPHSPPRKNGSPNLAQALLKPSERTLEQNKPKHFSSRAVWVQFDDNLYRAPST